MMLTEALTIAIAWVWHSQAAACSRGEVAGVALDLHGQTSAPEAFLRRTS